jgi:hypothetical protein
MDVHTGETTRFTSDPSATVAVPASGGVGQGRLFNDPGGHSFADTDQLPAVPRERRSARPGGAPRWLRFALVTVVVVILAAGAALALVKTGVIGKSTNPPANGQTQTHSTTPPTTAPKFTKQLLTPSETFSGGVSASYTIPARAFAVTVTAGPGISWVTIGIVGQAPIYEGILQPHTSQREILLGPGEVSVGAGGTTVKVTSGRKSQTLLPPSAPYSIQITPSS